MQWEHLTVPQFARAVEECGRVCVVPVGVIEPHATHLPLGQDMLASHWLTCRAAEIEPAVVFPPYPWGINHEAAHRSGAVVLRRRLVLDLLENVCDEIARNGLTKIVLFCGHGGNRFVLPLFVQTAVERRRAYRVYSVQIPILDETTRGLIESDEVGHAGEVETSNSLHMFGELVDMDALPAPHPSRRRLEALQQADVYGSMDWYAMYPTMYTGDASAASAEKGRAILQRRVERLAAALRAVKNDTVSEGLLAEFQDGMDHPTPPEA